MGFEHPEGLVIGADHVAFSSNIAGSENAWVWYMAGSWGSHEEQGLLGDPPPLDQAHQDEDDREHEQDMDE